MRIQCTEYCYISFPSETAEMAAPNSERLGTSESAVLSVHSIRRFTSHNIYYVTPTRPPSQSEGLVGNNCEYDKKGCETGFGNRSVAYVLRSIKTRGYMNFRFRYKPERDRGTERHAHPVFFKPKGRDHRCSVEQTVARDSIATVCSVEQTISRDSIATAVYYARLGSESGDSVTQTRPVTHNPLFMTDMTTKIGEAPSTSWLKSNLHDQKL
ncbi:hypothetical protein ABVT39_008678 [Epinephelus coioides]